MNFKIVSIWLGLSILMTIFWVIGIFIGNAFFPSKLMDASGDPNTHGELMLLIICLLNTLSILLFIYNSFVRGWKLVGIIFLIVFSIQFFMSQIETIWFNDNLKMPVNLIWAIVTGGAFMAFATGISATWFTGNFKQLQEYRGILIRRERNSLGLNVAVLSIVIWPIVYFTAGYLIAWQFSEVRVYYSGTDTMDTFYSIMKENVLSGLYFFQITRGLLWVLIAFLVLTSTTGSNIQKGIILGLLLSVLGSSQLLLPNPIMPDMVRIPHLIEISLSNFIWGLILAKTLGRFTEIRSIGRTKQSI